MFGRNIISETILKPAKEKENIEYKFFSDKSVKIPEIIEHSMIDITN